MAKLGRRDPESPFGRSDSARLIFHVAVQWPHNRFLQKYLIFSYWSRACSLDDQDSGAKRSFRSTAIAISLLRRSICIARAQKSARIRAKTKPCSILERG